MADSSRTARKYAAASKPSTQNKTDTTPPEKPTRISEQTFGTTTVRIRKSSDGTQFAEIRPKIGPLYHVPAEILSLAAGKDAWMRDIQLRWTGCGTRHRTGDMETGIYCPACVQAQEEENARVDRGE